MTVDAGSLLLAPPGPLSTLVHQPPGQWHLQTPSVGSLATDFWLWTMRGQQKKEGKGQGVYSSVPLSTEPLLVAGSPHTAPCHGPLPSLLQACY